MELLVQTKHLSVSFGSRTVLHDISVTLPASGISVLLGRSGSGKTTFLRALNRLNECFPACKTQGEVLLFSGSQQVSLYRSMSENALSALRRKVGMVFQTPNVLPASIAQNMLLPLKVVTSLSSRECEARMESCLSQVGLWQDVRTRLHDPASILSGGQQQRLCLARTLALAPSLLLLDEPTASLDPATTHDIEALLLRLSEHYPMLLVSHGLEQASRLASRLLLFSNGSLQGLYGPELLTQQAHLKDLFGYATGEREQ